MGYSPWGLTESDTTEVIKHARKVNDVLILNLFDGLFTNTYMSYHHIAHFIYNFVKYSSIKLKNKKKVD